VIFQLPYELLQTTVVLALHLVASYPFVKRITPLCNIALRQKEQINYDLVETDI